MTASWVTAALAIAGGIIVGALAGWLARRSLQAPGRREEFRQSAAAVGRFLLWLGTAAGIVLAVGATSPETLEPLPAEILSYLPNVLVAGLILIGGQALSVVLGSTANAALGRAGGSSAGVVAVAVRVATMTGAVILALGQLGVDTSILMILVGALAFSVGLALALLVALGGRSVAGEIAAGRVIRQRYELGDELRSTDAEGTMRAFHPAIVELETSDGGTVYVPNTIVLGSIVTVRRERDTDRPPPRAT